MALDNFFLLAPLDPATIITGYYDIKLVILSYMIAVFASYVALDMAGQLQLSGAIIKHRMLWILGGSVAMGAGIWSMHFIGMLAYIMPMSLYDINKTILSLFVAIVASFLALNLISDKRITRIYLILGGIILGLAISAMHYIGMESMKFHVNIHYKINLFILSILIGIFASEAALFLMVKSIKLDIKKRLLFKIISAFVMGVAICGLHYTGMEASVFTKLDTMTNMATEHSYSPVLLSISIAVVTLMILGIAFIVSTYKQLMQSAMQKKNEELALSNIELSKALEDIKSMQAQLIQSEKLAVLGQLVAGISHEINTPAGTIFNAVNEIKNDYTLLLELLLKLVRALPNELCDIYLANCKKVIGFPKDRDTSEERKIARTIEKVLVNEDIDNARYISKNFAIIGYDANNLGELPTLLQSPLTSEIQESLFQLGMSQLHVHDIAIAIDRIVALVKALKLYSHADKEEKCFTNLHEDMNNTLTILRSKLKKGITIVKEFDDIPDIKCHAGQLNQVWTNLINNATEAMNGTGEITIRLKHEDSTHVAVEIEDNGPGIKPEVLPRIFEYYFTTKDKGQGTGLGLSISKDIIDKHQGTITISSEPGKTLFKITLPLQIDHDLS